jgi:hypothetical protein
MKQQRLAIATALFFTLAAANAFSESLNNLVNSSRGKDVANFRLDTAELYARRDVSGTSSNYPFVDNQVEFEKGIVNFDRAKLPQNQAFIFDAISVKFGQGADGEDIAPGASAYSTDMIAALRNSDLKIMQGDRLVVQLPMASLYNPYTGQSQKDDWYDCGKFFHLNDKESFTWDIIYPKGQSVAAFGGAGTVKSLLEVRLQGYKSNNRSI